MFTGALNGYAAQGSYHPNDRFEDYKIRITTKLLHYWLSGMLNSSYKRQKDMKKELFSQPLWNRKLLRHDPNNLTYPDKELSTSSI